MGLARLCVIALAVTGCRQILGFEAASVPSPDGDPTDGPGDGPPVTLDTPGDAPVGWAFRKSLKITAAQVGGNLTNFPVLVRLAADAELAASARDDGFDLKFLASDGTTQLDHEIERFDGSSGALAAWVRLPTLTNNNDTTFFLYFGNPSATDQQNRTGVWDANYAGVWHLGETSGTSVADSTSLDRTGTKTSATTPSPTAGIIGGGQQFGGVTDGIAIGNDNDLDISSLTFETWILVPACANDIYRRIIDFTVAFTSSWAVAYPCTGAPTVNQKSVVIDLPSGLNLQTPVNSLTSDVAHHFVFQTGPARIVIDGTERGLSSAPFGLAQDNVLTIIGGRETTADRSVIGMMDEVRISKVRRSQGYITTSHNNQRPGSTFLTVGAVEAAP